MKSIRFTLVLAQFSTTVLFDVIRIWGCGRSSRHHPSQYDFRAFDKEPFLGIVASSKASGNTLPTSLACAIVFSLNDFAVAGSTGCPVIKRRAYRRNVDFPLNEGP